MLTRNRVGIFIWRNSSQRTGQVQMTFYVYNPPYMRKFIIIIMLFLGAAFVYLSFGEIQTVMQTLREGNFWFVLIALMIEFGWFIVAGLTFRSLYLLLGIDETVYKLS